MAKVLPKEEQLVFLVQPISPDENAKLKDQSYKATGIGKKRAEYFVTGSVELQVIKKCLKGWKNFKDQDNKDVPFSWDNVAYIPGDIITEISNFARGFLEEEEETEEFGVVDEKVKVPQEYEKA